MADERIFKITINGLTESYESTTKLVDKLKELEKIEKKIATEMKKVSKAIEESTKSSKSRTEAIKKETKEQEKLSKAINKGTEAIKEQTKELEASTKQVKEHTESTKELTEPQEAIANSIAGMTTQISEWKKELESLDVSSEEFKELSKDIAALEDKLSSSTDSHAYFQTMANGISQATQASGTMLDMFKAGIDILNTFGLESDTTTKMLSQLGKVQGTLTAIQTISNAMTKESALMQGILTLQLKARTQAELLSTSTTKGATIAQAAFNVIANANPYVLLATALITVIGALALFASGTSDAAAEQDRLNHEMDNNKQFAEESARGSAKQLESFDKLRKGWNALGDDLKSKEQYIKDNRDKFKDLGVEIKNVKDAENLLVKNAATFIEATKLKAQSVAAQNLASQEYQKMIQQEIEMKQNASKIEALETEVQKQSLASKALSILKYVNVVAAAFAFFSGHEDPEAQLRDAQKKQREYEKDIENTKKLAAEYQEKADKLSKEAAEKLKDSDIKPTDDKNDKGNKKNLDDKRKQQEEMAKMLKEEQDKRIKDERTREIKAIEEASAEKLKKIKGDGEEETKLRKLIEENKQKELQKVNEKYDNQAIEESLNIELSTIEKRLALAEEGSDEYYAIKKEEAAKLAEIESVKVMNSITSEEEMANRLIEINTNLNKDLDKLDKESNNIKKDKSLKDLKDNQDKELLETTKKYEQKLITKEEYEAEVARINHEALGNEIEIRKAMGEDVTNMERTYSEQSISIAEKAGDERTKALEKLKAKVEDISKKITEATGAIFDAWGSVIDAQLEEANAKLEEVTTKYDEVVEKREESSNRLNELEEEAKNASGGRFLILQDQINQEMIANQQLAAQEKELAKEKEKQEKEIAKKEKEQKKMELAQNIVQGLSNTALAVTNAMLVKPFPLGVAMAAIAGSMGAVQIGVMTKQLSKLEDGGMLKGKRHREGGMRIEGTNIEVEGGEYVINRQSTAKNLGLIRYINNERRELKPNDINTFFGKSAQGFEPPFRTMFEKGGKLPTVNTNTSVNNEYLVDAIKSLKIEPKVAVTDINTVQENMVQVDSWTGL